MTSSVTNTKFYTGLYRASGLLILIAVFLLFNQYIGFPQKIPVDTQSLQTQTSTEVIPYPTRIIINKIGVNAPIIKLGLNPDQTLATPKTDTDVGWYTGSPAPGGLGPSIIVGHLDSVRGPAVFWNLKNLQVGDEFSINRADGSVADFRVDSMETYSQDNFPSDKVYGTIDYRGIRVITCSGTYSLLKGHYSDNLVVYGSLVGD